MAGKEQKKFIVIERDKDNGGPFICEGPHGILYFDNYGSASEYADNHIVDPTIVNMY